SKSVIRGTLLYMSPEALLGDRPDPSFDIWSLCVALYESIAGKNPLAGAGGRGAIALLSGFEFPDIRTIAPAAPNELAELFAAALCAAPARRPLSGAQMHKQVSQVCI